MLPIHTVLQVNGSNTSAKGFSRPDQASLGLAKSVPNGAGTSAGAAVVIAVTFAEPLPENYAVHVDPKQDATWWTDTQTANGFNVNLAPRLAANTLASGTFDVGVIGG